MSGARFLGGAARGEQALAIGRQDLPLIALAGRSNVGKSSLLNRLVGTAAARVSSAPGKTREMNFFEWRVSQAQVVGLVDLPGYGYAKVAAETRSRWGREVSGWLRTEERIRLVVLLCDGRHGLMPMDLDLAEYLGSRGHPFLVAFTKMDKWKSANQRLSAEGQLAKVARESGVPAWVFVSSVTPHGHKPLLAAIREILSEAKGQ